MPFSVYSGRFCKNWLPEVSKMEQENRQQAQAKSVQEALQALPANLLETVHQSALVMHSVEDVERFRQHMTQG